MMNEGLSAGDILALTRDQDGMGNAWNNPFIYLVWLALLGGNGGLFGNRDNGALQSSLTRSDLFEGFNNQDVNSQLRGITNGVCDGFYAINSGLKDGFYGNQGAMKDGFYGIQGAQLRIVLPSKIAAVKLRVVLKTFLPKVIVIPAKSQPPSMPKAKPLAL